MNRIKSCYWVFCSVKMAFNMCLFRPYVECHPYASEVKDAIYIFCGRD